MSKKILMLAGDFVDLSVRSAYLFSEEEIGYAVRTQLTWTHLRPLMGVKDELIMK